jgi:predicted signal transduction protein with EAL and GGDEF domain
MPVGKGMVGHALRGRRLVVVNDVERGAPPEYLTLSRRAGYRAAAVVPFMVEDRAVGAYMLYSREPDVFDEPVVKLLEDVGSHISFALSYLQQREDVERLAYYDALTGLPNALLFQEQVNGLIAAPGADGPRVAVVALGLERMGELTESFGPEAAEAALSEVARRLASWAADEGGFAARPGSDYFTYAVLSTGDTEALVDQALRCIARIADDAHFVSGQKVSPVVRAGIAWAGDGPETAALLAVNAQAALRTAREALERVVLYAPEMNARVAARFALETQLRNAHREQQFALHYQPRFDLESGALTGLEALLRWTPPRGNRVAPADFVPVLEETGLIVDVGRWIFERVAADVRMWRALGRVPVRVSVNVSAVQVRDARFVDHIARVLDDANVREVDMELTESTLMSDVEDNIARLTALREMGLGVIIDDFGTGYSSLSYLVRLPITAIKIDRSFVADIATHAEQAAVVSAMASLARTLGLRVIAEGVETEAQAAALRALHCDEVQGFLYGRPLPAPDVAALLVAEPVTARG